MDLVVSLRVRREKTFLRGVKIAWLSGRAGELRVLITHLCRPSV